MLVRTLFLSVALTVPSCLAYSSTITNNVPWTDTDGNNIKANRKPNISEKIGNYWYLVGSESTPECEPDVGGEIFIYRSETLGSDSWEFVQTISDVNVRSCVMNVHSGDTVYLHCRRTVCVSRNGPEGDYNCDQQLNMPNFYPTNNSTTRKVGGSSTFRDDDGSLYFITSRKERQGSNGDRSVFIYKFKENDWTQIYEVEVASFTYENRESPQIVKNNGKYYLFTSRAARWESSETSYLESDSLEGFSSLTKETDEKQVVMHPEDTNDIKSMGTQFGFIQKFGDEETWFFSGRRHPKEDPCNFGQEYGSLVMTSFEFDDGVPHVYWKGSFDWKSADYNRTGSEEHEVESYKPTCVDTTEKFYMKSIDKWKNCNYVFRTNTERRCNVEGVADNCQKTCKVFYCDPLFCDKDNENDTHLKECPAN